MNRKQFCLKSIQLETKIAKQEVKQNTSIKLEIYVPATIDSRFTMHSWLDWAISAPGFGALN